MRVPGRVLRNFPIAGSDDRVVLFSWSADTDAVKKNIARIDRNGNVVWRAAPPTPAVSDCFVSLAAEGDDFVARTYSEWTVRLAVDGCVRYAVREPQVV